MLQSYAHLNNSKTPKSNAQRSVRAYFNNLNYPDIVDGISQNISMWYLDTKGDNEEFKLGSGFATKFITQMIKKMKSEDVVMQPKAFFGLYTKKLRFTDDAKDKLSKEKIRAILGESLSSVQSDANDVNEFVRQVTIENLPNPPNTPLGSPKDPKGTGNSSSSSQVIKR